MGENSDTRETIKRIELPFDHIEWILKNGYTIHQLCSSKGVKIRVKLVFAANSIVELRGKDAAAVEEICDAIKNKKI